MRRLAYGWKLLGEFGQFARQNKVYWIIPLAILLLLTALVVFGSQSTAPLFIYTLY